MLVKIYNENPSEKEIDRVVNLLERDGVVIYPTDSVYAFGCSIRSAKAVEQLRRIKEGSHDVFRRVRFARADCRLLPGG